MIRGLNSNIIKICNRTTLLNSILAEILKSQLGLYKTKQLKTTNIIIMVKEIEVSRNTLFFTSIEGLISEKDINPSILVKNNVFLLVITKKNYSIEVSNKNIIEFLKYKGSKKQKNINKELYILNISKGMVINKKVKSMILEHKNKTKRGNNKTILFYIKLKHLLTLNV
ncbi:hypothetical protein [Candidatus Vidania fulgoroideorum]